VGNKVLRRIGVDESLSLSFPSLPLTSLFEEGILDFMIGITCDILLHWTSYKQQVARMEVMN
jgi:hypothetical protein